MTALAAPRNTLYRNPSHIEPFAYPLGANARVWAGGLVVIEATGFAGPGRTALNLICVGRAEESVDNTGGAAGAKTVDVRRGICFFANTAADLIVQADVGKQCFLVDDDQVAKTNGTNTRSAAGIVRAVETGGVWVEI